jgi:hypothetical protein
MGLPLSGNLQKIKNRSTEIHIIQHTGTLPSPFRGSGGMTSTMLLLLAAVLQAWLYLSNWQTRAIVLLYLKKNSILFIKFAGNISVWNHGTFYKALDLT